MLLNMLNDDVCVLSSRNLGEKDKGCLQEIGFQEFVTVLSFFRPPKPRTADEEMKNIKKEKLRCENTDVSIAALFSSFYRYQCYLNIIEVCLHLRY